MNLIKVNTIPSIFSRVDNVIDGFFNAYNDSAWSPRCDILENDAEYVISIDVPGIEKKNINIDKVMAKVDEAIKDIDKNLQVKNLIKLEVMANDQASLTGYATIPFYKSKDIYLNQLNMSDPRLLYTEVTLNKYKVNDPVFKKQELLHNIKLKKQKLLIELEQLKNG